ncbi:MAG: hypothetical protein Fur0032_19290 [Terrimicrobiaceae bacterium]
MKYEGGKLKTLPDDEVTEGRDAVYVGRDADGNPIPEPGYARESFVEGLRKCGTPEDRVAHFVSLRWPSN